MAGYSSVLVTKGDYESAYDIAKKAIVLDPDNFMAWFAFGDAASMTNRIDEAIHAYEYALSLDPTHQSALIFQYNIGSLSLVQGNFPKARLSFEKALQIDDLQALIWLNKGAAEYESWGLR